MDQWSMGAECCGSLPRRRMVNSNISCGALVYSVSTHRYLFLLRNTKRHAGSWGLVGGKVEEGETPAQALHREIQEEVGGFEYTKIIPLEQFTSDNNSFIYHTFLIKVDAEFVPLLNHEHRGYAWTSIEDHPKPLHPGVWRTFNFQVILEKIKTLESILR
jgi:8-oxo-dGTP pyrophosphatase MutT (NUDIX family)